MRPTAEMPAKRYGAPRIYEYAHLLIEPAIFGLIPAAFLVLSPPSVDRRHFLDQRTTRGRREVRG